jgi:hypothetical protein
VSFQWIIDNAESISIDTKKVIGSTTTRNGTFRSVSRGGQVWRFEVQLPAGPRWTDYRQRIATAEALDRTTTATISLNDTGQAWMYQYQGNSVNITGFAATWTAGATTITLTSSPTTSSGFKFRAGDLIQLGTTGKCYRISADVAFNSNTVTVHRPIIDATGSGSLRVAQNCEWTVICAEFPTWTLFARDQVSWSGPFVFVESLV